MPSKMTKQSHVERAGGTQFRYDDRMGSLLVLTMVLVDTAAYIQNYTEIASTQLGFLRRRLLLLITRPFTIPPFLQTLLCP